MTDEHVTVGSHLLLYSSRHFSVAKPFLICSLSPTLRLGRWLYFCFINKRHDFSKAAELVSRLDSDRRPPEPCKGSCRRDVHREKAPAHGGGQQAGGRVGVVVAVIIGSVLGCVWILGCEDSWSPPTPSQVRAWRRKPGSS